MFSKIRDRIAGAKLIAQERPAATIVMAMALSAMLAGTSLYLFVFAGRSLLPEPLSGGSPVPPHTTSVPVQTVALVQPAVQPPAPPAPVPDAGLSLSTGVSSGSGAGATAVAGVTQAPDDDDDDEHEDEGSRAQTARAYRQHEGSSHKQERDD